MIPFEYIMVYTTLFVNRFHLTVCLPISFLFTLWVFCFIKKTIWWLTLKIISILKTKSLNGIDVQVFIYCLGLLKEVDLLTVTDTNYYNIFGNVEEIYCAHYKFWENTLLPCLQKVRHNVLNNLCVVYLMCGCIVIGINWTQSVRPQWFDP